MSRPDAYIEYTHRFFERWLPVYDLFALPIGFAYRGATNLALRGPGHQVLDLCTGTGEVALRLARRGAAVTGVDVTAAMLEKAKRKARRLPADKAPRFEVMDARRLDFPDRSFDATVISLALHDMPRTVRTQVLREACRVSRHRLVILDYELPRWTPAHRLFVRAISLFESAYFPHFAQEGLQPLLDELGHDVLRRVSYRALGFGIVVVDPWQARG